MFTRLVVFTVAGACMCLCWTRAMAAESNAERSRKLVAVLESEDASFFEKARACQQLGEFGEAQAVPALAALLRSDHLSAYARSGLENIPDPRAAEALRSAAGKLEGELLIGVIDSLGVVRDSGAVGLLERLAKDAEPGVAGAALRALGCIGSEPAVGILRRRLVEAPEAMRAGAAVGCLLAAEKQIADGKREAGVALYDAVRAAEVSLLLRAAGTRGAIVARGTAGVGLLMETLRSDERLLRNVALTAIREIPSDTLAGALNAALQSSDLPAEVEVQVIEALADCHNTYSLAALEEKAGSSNPEARQRALGVLGRMGGGLGAAALLKALVGRPEAEEAAIALNGLKRMEGEGIDGQILDALAGAPEADGRIRLLGLLKDRGATKAAGGVLGQAAGAADPAVRVAALRALESLGGPAQLAPLLQIVASGGEAAVREAAENAVVDICIRTGSAGAGTEAVLAEYARASNAALKASWIRILAGLGQAPGLPAMLSAMGDADESVAVAAIAQLARWPDPAPVEALLGVMRSGATPARRQRALISVIRLATAAAEERQRPAAMLAGWFEQAGQAAETVAERRLILSGLGRLPHLETLRLLAPYGEDGEVRNEAAAALIQVAPVLKAAEPAAVRAALERVVATCENADLRGRAAKLLASLSSPARWISLFDGRTLAGWEGNTNVWRVRDGVIVGGFLAGNPHNEFLTTVREYTNFVLRLEYKLVGSEGFVNGGVQFRSRRVQQPANEMSGYQADLGAGHTGSLYDESRRNQFLVRAAEEQIKRLERPGAWNRYEVRCAGPRIQIALNGQKTVDFTERDPAILLAGLIGLQIHGDCKAEISFRELSLEELSYGVATREFGLPKSGWEVVSCSSENTEVEDERAVLAIDGNPETFWHTLWHGGSPGHPHHLAVDLGQRTVITGFAYLPRQDGRHVKGVIGEYAVHVSDDGTGWGQPVVEGRFENADLDASGRVVLLSRPVTARYFKLVSRNAPGHEPYAGAAEIDVLGEPAR